MTSDGEVVHQPESRRVILEPRFTPSLIALVALLALAAIIAFGQTMSLPFFADDLDLLLQAGSYRAGDVSLPQYLSMNHNEHRMPIMRVLVYLATMTGNLDARVFHAAVLGVHIWCAALVTLIARPMLRWPFAFLCGLLFVVSGAYSSMVIWAPTCAVFSLSLLFVLLAQHSLANYERVGVWLASAALLCAMLTVNANVITVPLLGLAYWERLGSSRARRAVVLFVWLVVAARIFLWSSVMFVDRGDGLVASVWPAIRNGGFLVLSAPIRWVLAWALGSLWSIPKPLVILATLPAVLLLVIGALSMPRAMRKHVIFLLLCACGLAMAIGYGRRAESFSVLYGTDRYYYAFGAPFALVTGELLYRLLGRFATRYAVGLLLLLTLAMGTLQSRRLLAPQLVAPHIQAERDAMEQARKLALLLRDETAVRPMRVPDGLIPFAGVHKDGMTLLTIVYGVFPGGLHGLEFMAPGAATEDARLNELLGNWARSVGWLESPVVAEKGYLNSVKKSEIDFRKGAISPQVDAGFHGWNSSERSRWMSKRGVLELPHTGQKRILIEAQLPARDLRKAGVITKNDEVVVRANGTPVGVLKFNGATPSREASSFLAVSVRLSASRWKARSRGTPGRSTHRTKIHAS